MTANPLHVNPINALQQSLTGYPGATQAQLST
jgi:hypothetical protein